MESTSTGWGYVIIHLPSITNTNGKCSLLQEYNNTISVFSDCIKFSNNYSKWRYFLFASSKCKQTESEHSFEKCRRIQIDKK